MSRIDTLRRRMPPLLVLALGGAAAALSWDALRAVALTTGAVHHDVMAGVWALCIDLLWIACMRAAAKAMPGRRKWALAGLVVGVGFSGFQVFTPWTWLARMVPVTALLVAWMLETFVVSHGPDPAVEVTDGIAPVPVPRGNPATGSVHPHRGGRLPSAPGVGVGSPVVERAIAGVGDPAAARPLGDVEGGRGPAGATVPRVGPDGVASGDRRPMTIGEAVRYLIDEGGLNPHETTPGRIIDQVRRLTGKPAVSTGAIGNALSQARKNASSNGGMRVR
jgi:hypothetical protein